jgi:hypothetical protein
MVTPLSLFLNGELSARYNETSDSDSNIVCECTEINVRQKIDSNSDFIWQGRVYW